MATIRTDLDKAGLLSKHPDVKEGFPEGWRSETFGEIGRQIQIGGPSGIEDDQIAEIHYYSKLMDAVDNRLVRHLPIGEDVYMLFYKNHVLGQVKEYQPDYSDVELINAHAWTDLLEASGFSWGSMSLMAPYDPKIYLTPDLKKWVNNINEDYDPYKMED